MLDNKEKIDYKPIIASVLLQVLLTVALGALMALIMCVTDLDLKYSPVLGTVATGIGAFFGAYMLSSKKGSKGYLYGLMVGFITFLIITVVGLILNNGAISINSLFHLIIFVISGILGGVLGVNKKPKSYI